MLQRYLQIFLIASLVMCGATSWAQADETQQTAPLSLEQCIGIAMQNQLDILVGKNNVIAAKSRSIQAKSTYFPQLSIQNNAFHIGSQGVLNKVTNGTAFNVTQNLFDGGLREATASSARYGVVENNAKLSRTTQSVTYDVTKAYYEVLRAKHLADVADANVKYTGGLRDQIKARAELGDAAAVDVLPVESQLANAQVNLLSAKNAVRNAALQLQNAMGVSPSQKFDVQDIGSAPEMDIQPLEIYQASASKDRPDIKETTAGLGAAKASVRSARINLYPRPVISGQYQREIAGGFTTSGTQVVGGIVFDIFNGGANKAAYKEARALQVSAEQQQKQVYKDIEVQVEEAYLNLTSAKERLAASEIGLAAAQKNNEAQIDRYNQGLGITLDLLNAELQLITAQTNEVEARYDYYVAAAQLEYAVGKQGGPDASKKETT
ncbi:MAG: TolC family protein [Armatimonadota bacterium]|nr:TolC family protein [bacterium]